MVCLVLGMLTGNVWAGDAEELALKKELLGEKLRSMQIEHDRNTMRNQIIQQEFEVLKKDYIKLQEQTKEKETDKKVK